MQAVELDPVILNLARNYFGFVEDDRLKVACDSVKLSLLFRFTM